MPAKSSLSASKQIFMIGATVTLVLLPGCATKNDYTGSVSPAATTADAPRTDNDAELARNAEKWGKKFARNNKDLGAGINYARHLRALNRSGEAVGILRQLQAHYPTHKDVLAELGKSQAQAGNFEEALQNLTMARQQGNTDWRILSTQGTTLDQLGRSDEAQAKYREALKLAPGEPSILSNLGLSLALNGNLDEAERTLHEAVKHPRATNKVRENLALVLGLQGKFEEAEKIAAPSLPQTAIANNTAYMKSLLDQPDHWSQLQQETPGQN